MEPRADSGLHDSLLPTKRCGYFLGARTSTLRMVIVPAVGPVIPPVQALACLG